MDLTDRIAALAAPGAEQAGLVLDGVSVSPAGKRTRVTVTLDLPEDTVGSADLDSIAQASRAIGAALDEANVPSTPYVLEVGTPGTDRPLTERRHFLRARTRLLAIVLVDGTQALARLTDVDGDTLVLAAPHGEERVAIADIAEARIEVELKRLDQED